MQTYRVFKGFIGHGNEFMGPLLYLVNFAIPVDVGRTALFIVEIIISDMIMVRVFVCNRQHRLYTEAQDHRSTGFG